jgi:flagellar biosynthesis/type III secretory pathway chaperone
MIFRTVQENFIFGFYSCENANELETVMNEEIQALFKYCAINKLSVN